MSDDAVTEPLPHHLRRCSNCRLWQGEENDGYRQCQWVPSDLPFWANCGPDTDHGDWTRASDGKYCATWELDAS